MKKQTIKFIFLGLILCGIFGFSNSTKAVWYNSSWGYKKAITIESGYSTGVATTTNAGFVVVASTTQEFLKDTGQANGRIAQGMGYDIIFVDDDDTTLLPFEYEKYASSTGSLVAFVRVPDISSTTDKTIYMYYGNASATNNATSGATWAKTPVSATTTVGMWHMQYSTSTSPTQKMMDSTNYSNNGTMTLTDASEQVPGQLDGSFSFDGVDDYVDVVGSSVAGHSLDFTGNQPFTIEAWVKSSWAYLYNPIVVKGQGSDSYQYGLIIQGGSYWGLVYVSLGRIDSFYSANFVVPKNTWTHVVVVCTGANILLFVDGINKPLTGSFTPLVHQAYDTKIGVAGSYRAGGLIDDVRIYNYALTQADIKTQYNMSSRNDLFLTWGAEQGGEAPPAGGGGANVGNIIFFE